MFKTILKPYLYHGAKKKKNYFEGWYYKISDKDNEHSIAIIPGIIKGKTKGKGNAFIQFIYNTKSYYREFSLDAFTFSFDPFSIMVKDSKFSLSEIKLNLVDDEIQINGQIRFLNVTKWPDSIVNPGSMGFYNYIRFMECYSDVCILDGITYGHLTINDEEIDFTDGKIYIEKNWGKSFPESYIWIQANNFVDKTAFLSVSYGRVPFWFYRFNGFLTAFSFNNKIYKFTTINRSKVELLNYNDNIKIIFKNKEYELYIETKCDKEDFVSIKGPIDGEMTRMVKESIISDVRVELVNIKQNVLLFQGVSKNGGVEFMGDLWMLKHK